MKNSNTFETNLTLEKGGLSRSNKIVFTILMILIPVLFLIIVEGGLRLFNYGGNLDLFVLDEPSSVREYILNKNFTRRYFFKKGIKTPIPLSQKFSAEKDTSTYRVFCLGASTTQGFPYTPNAAYPAQLQNILNTIHQDKKLEVINCGITALSSYPILDMTQEIIQKYAPDLLVVYCGHNEFYGVFGQASVLSLFNNHSFVRTFLKLQQSKLVLLLRNVLSGLFMERVTQESVTDHATMMGTIAKDIAIPWDSDLRRTTEQNYRKNIIDIVKQARAADTDILLCNLVANISDLVPFSAQQAGENSTPSDFDSVKQAEIYKRNKQYRRAVEIFGSLIGKDSTNAYYHFQLGKIYQAWQKNKLAYKHLQLAKDFDTIRFRAPSSFNHIIHEIAEQYQVPLVNIEDSFRRASPVGVIGTELIMEHVHPNPIGHFLMAEAIAKTMSQSGLIDQIWNWENHRDVNSYLEMCHLTELDHEAANYSIFRLTSHWPFSDAQRERNYVRIGSERTEQLVQKLIDREESNLAQLHLDFGKELIDGNETARGLREYKAALAIEPHCDIYNRIGPVHTKMAELAYRESRDYRSALDNYQQALMYLQMGLQRCPQHIALNFNLGLLYALRSDQLENALNCFQKVLTLDPTHKNSMRMLAQLNLRRKEYDMAAEYLLNAIEFYPEEVGFYTELGYIYAFQKKFVKARYWLNKALDLQPDHKKTQSLLLQIRYKKDK